MFCVAVFSRYKMSGELPLLSLRISDDKLRNVLGLIESIPLPKTRPAAHGATSSYTSKVRRAVWLTDAPSHCRSDKLEGVIKKGWVLQFLIISNSFCSFAQAVIERGTQYPLLKGLNNCGVPAAFSCSETCGKTHVVNTENLYRSSFSHAENPQENQTDQTEPIMALLSINSYQFPSLVRYLRV